MAKCKYYRMTDLETYTPDCGVEFGDVSYDVHPYDAVDYKYCPHCGRKVKLVEGKDHPDVREG